MLYPKIEDSLIKKVDCCVYLSLEVMMHYINVNYYCNKC